MNVKILSDTDLKAAYDALVKGYDINDSSRDSELLSLRAEMEKREKSGDFAP